MKNIIKFIVAAPIALFTQELIIEGTESHCNFFNLEGLLITLGIFLLALWVLSSIIVDIAERKHFTNLGLWRVLGLFFFPIALICVIVKDEKPDLSDTKICPFCAERIKKDAKVCHYCGHEVE